jgi:hypothetical protein
MGQFPRMLSSYLQTMILYFIMIHSSRSDLLKHRQIGLALLTIIMMVLAGCQAPDLTPTKTESPTPAPSGTTLPSPSLTLPTFTPMPSSTPTPGPSPTSTALPDLVPRSWQGQAIMVEAAHIDSDPLAPFSYTPLFVLYGDGWLVKRNCQDGECRYLGSQLDSDALCQLVNTIDRTGFLDVDPKAFSLPGGTGASIRLSVQLNVENQVQIPDLDRWIEDPNWYGAFTGCPNCFSPPQIDPAFIDLFRLLTTYPDPTMVGFQAERLAVWLTQPVIAGASQDWHPDLLSLSELAARSACPGDPTRSQAVILDGSTARGVSSFLSTHDEGVPIFSENGKAWQVHSRWLLPYEMPQTCDRSPGLYPPPDSNTQYWQCVPEMGSIPTSTATITPTPSVTPTPLR